MASATTAILPLYDLAMYAAMPFLWRNERLREGWDQRVFHYGLPAPADLWMQAASVGEAFLAWEVIKQLENPLPDRPLKVLLTTNTKEGMSILTRALQDQSSRTDLRFETAYFPLDAPSIMRRALRRIRPSTAVLLESEIWPGFLAACRANHCEVLLINGRMSTRSMAGYLSWPRFFKDLGPDRVMAMSEDDTLRFAAIYGPERVETMPNIKFDRLLTPAGGSDHNPLTPFFGETAPFTVFGSVRKEEEPQVALMIEGFRAARPGTTIGLFPRHLQRVDDWATRLGSMGIPFALRSETRDRVSPGTLLLWDRVGEMGQAFKLARSAFIGGSLAPVGGQNFLEPLAEGIIPVIGPHWKNFAWVGREIVDSGLVRERATWREALAELLALTARPAGRAGVLKRFVAYVSQHRGGSQAAAARIAQSLTRV